MSEEAVELIDALSNEASPNGKIAALIGFASVIAASIFVGYKIGVKRTTLKYEAILESEIEKAKEHYQRINKTGDFETPESAVETLIGPDAVEKTEAKRALKSYQGGAS